MGESRQLQDVSVSSMIFFSVNTQTVKSSPLPWCFSKGILMCTPNVEGQPPPPGSGVSLRDTASPRWDSWVFLFLEWQTRKSKPPEGAAHPHISTGRTWEGRSKPGLTRAAWQAWQPAWQVGSCSQGCHLTPLVPHGPSHRVHEKAAVNQHGRGTLGASPHNYGNSGTARVLVRAGQALWGVTEGGGSVRVLCVRACMCAPPRVQALVSQDSQGLSRPERFAFIY